MIRQLPDDVKSYIRSGVAITSITQCVEELLLNSIDAGATCVAVRVDVGCFKVQVVDNGHGITEKELPLIGNRYTTSKCHTVSDLDDLRYFGYRGEALASIKDACGILEIVTKTKSSPKPLCKLFQDGKALPIKESAIARPSVGTTITVHALFMNFPVRQKSVNEGLELEKIRQRVAGLALMKPHVSVRLRNDSTGATVIHTKKCSNTLVTFASLFGQTKADSLVEIKGEKDQFSLDGFIGCEGSTKKDVQFVYINGRLVLKTKIHKLISQLLKKSAICKRKFSLASVSPMLPDNKEMLRKSPGKQLDKQPMFIVNVKCPLTEYDITFDPAKTLVEFKDWDKLLLCITDVVNEFLKKENLFTGSPHQECTKTDQGTSDNAQCVTVISPSNLRDVLISKTARKYVPKSKINLQTPAGIPLDKWKSENTSIHKRLDDTSTSSSGILSEDTSMEQTASFTDTDRPDTDISRETSSDSAPGTSQIVNSRTKESQCAITHEKPYVSMRPSKENPLCIDKQVVVNANTETVASSKTGACRRSSLSAFKQLVGKPSGSTASNMSTRMNVDESLKKISKILPSSSTSTSIEDKSQKALSSLQKFRTFASKFEHKVSHTDIEVKQRILPAKFSKINDVPMIKNRDALAHDFVGSKPIRKGIPVMETHSKQSIVDKVAEPKHHLSKNSESNTNTSGSSVPIVPDRKRPGSIPDQTSAKMIKVTDYRTEKILPASNCDSIDRQNGDHNACFEQNFDGQPNDKDSNERNCDNSDHVIKDIPQPRYSSHLQIHHVHCKEDGTSKSSDIENKIIHNERIVSKPGNARQVVGSSSKSVTEYHLNEDLPIVCMPSERLMNAQGDASTGHNHNINNDRDSQMLNDMPNACRSLPSPSPMTMQCNTGLEFCDSPNSVRGSQLFKHLPDIDNAMKESNNDTEEIFTAIPLNTYRLIQDIVKAGVDLQNKAPCDFSSQECIPSSLDEEMESERVIPSPNDSPNIKDASETHSQETGFESLMLDATQEFTPSTAVEEQFNGELTSSHGFAFETSDTQGVINKEGTPTSNVSPSSTGFTPQMVEEGSPGISNNTINEADVDDIIEPNDINNTINESTTGDVKVASDVNNVINEATVCNWKEPEDINRLINESTTGHAKVTVDIINVINEASASHMKVPFDIKHRINEATVGDMKVTFNVNNTINEASASHMKIPVDESIVTNTDTSCVSICDNAFITRSLSDSDGLENDKISDEMDTSVCDADVSQISQDTLDMPSILESSRLNNSDIEMAELVSSNYWNRNEVNWLDNLPSEPHLFQRRKYQRDSEWQEKDSDDVTVTQLLDMTTAINPSQPCEIHQKLEDILTFRDIFTPTQSQHKGVKESVENVNSKGQNGESKKSSTIKDYISKEATDEDLFTDTFDDVIVSKNETEEPVGMVVDDDLAVTNDIAEQNGGTKEKEVCGKMPEVQSDTQECEADKTNTGDDDWIEMKHPHTGKKMYIHSKLGSVRDSLDVTTNKQNSDSHPGLIRTPRKALVMKMNTSVRLKPPDTITGPSSSSVTPSSTSSSTLGKMLCEHFERDEEEIGIKWRDRQGHQTEISESRKVTDLFSEWENPVFNTVGKSVLSIETGNITNKCSLKAMKSLHTCRFTKDMLQTVKVVGQLDNKFIVCLIKTDSSLKEPDVLAVVDQHAAHERVRLELLTEEAYLDGDVEKGELAKFNVKLGKAIKIDEDEIQVMMCYRDEFSRIGVTFRVDTHLDNVIKVLSVPECLIDKDAPEQKRTDSIYWDTIQTLIKGHVELLKSTEGAKGRMPAIIHKLLCSQACHGAIKFGDPLSLDECKSLIHDLSLCDLPFQCAHGRPAVIPVLQLQQLETRLPQQKQKPQLQKLRMAIKKKAM